MALPKPALAKGLVIAGTALYFSCDQDADTRVWPMSWRRRSAVMATGDQIAIVSVHVFIKHCKLLVLIIKDTCVYIYIYM